MYVSFIERSTQFDIIIFSDEFLDIEPIMGRGLSAKDISKFATVENEHFNFIAKLKSANPNAFKALYVRK